MTPATVREGVPHLGTVPLVGKKSRVPKIKCCVSKSRCSRCPIRMLKEGTLPEGYTVKKRKLVKVKKQKLPKAA
jgi:hypothetical protein